MKTFKNMVNQIAEDLGRIDLEAGIKDAIRSSIWFYQTKDFGFNREIYNMKTTKCVEHYELPKECLVVLKVSAIDNAHDRYFLKSRLFAQDFLSFGMPKYYRIEGKKLYLTPVPDQEYGIDVCFLKNYPALNNDDDVHPFFEHIYELIRIRAKAHICLHNLHNFDDAEKLKNYETRLYEEVSSVFRPQRHNLFIQATSF